MTPISEIEAAARAATQGEWQVVTDLPAAAVVCFIDGQKVAIVGSEFHKGPFRQGGILEHNATHIALCNPATIIALCEDLMACMDALCAADATMPYDGHINDMARSVVSSALQRLQKWGG